MLNERLNELRQTTIYETLFIEWLENEKFAELNQFCEQHYPAWLESKKNEEMLCPQINILSLCDIHFLLSKFSSKQTLYTKLKAWYHVAPSFANAFLLGEFWLQIIEDERGHSYANYVSERAWQKASWARDMAFYWGLTAITLDPQKVWSYTTLHSATGFLGIPDWLWKNEKVEKLGEYHYPIEDARLFFESYGENDVVPIRSFPESLPTPTEDELAFPLDYWFARITALAPFYLYPYTVHIYYLYPRWYGEGYSDIDAFLANPRCQSLSKEKYNALLIKKAYDTLQNFPEFGSPEQEEQKRLFKELLSLRTVEHVKIKLLLDYIRFCDEYVLNDKIEHHTHTKEYAQTIMNIAEDLLAHYEKGLYWEDNTANFVSIVCWWLTGIRNVLGEDSAKLRKRVIQLLASRSSFTKTLEIGATTLGIWGFEKDQIDIDWKTLITEDRDEDFDIDNAIRYFAMDGYPQYAIELYKKLATLGHAFSQYRLYQIQRNLYCPEFFEPYNQFTEEEGEAFLAQAVNQGLTEALVTFGLREYDRLWPMSKRPKIEADRALSALRKAVERKQTEVYIPYIHLLYLETKVDQEGYIFKELIPELMFDCEFSQEDFAWLANLYAVAFKEGFGVEKNLYVSLFWSEQACLLEPSNEVFQQFFKDNRIPSSIFLAKSRFDKLLNNNKTQIPEWIIPIAEHFMELSESYETRYPLEGNKFTEEEKE